MGFRYTSRLMSHEPDAIVPQSSPPTHAYLALVLGVLTIGFAPIFVKLADASGDVVGFYRMAIGASAISLPMLIRWRQGKVRLPRRGVWLAVLAGVCFAIDIGVWNQSLRYTTASNATFLGNTAPIWVGLGVWLFFKERLRSLYWVGLAVALAGAFLLVGLDGLDGSQAALGNVMALSVGLAYAGYQLAASRARQQVDNLSFMWVFSLTGAIALGVVALLLRSPFGGLTTGNILALFALGLLTHTGGWLLINSVYSVLPASVVTIVLLGQPIVATLFAAPILGEVPTGLHILGGLITLSGIYLVLRSRQGD